MGDPAGFASRREFATWLSLVPRHVGPGKAIIAAARGLLDIIYNTLKNGWAVAYFPTYTLAEQPVQT